MHDDLEKVIGITVGKYPHHLHKDLYQECWIVALEKVKDFDPEKSNLMTFLYLRLHGVCKNWIKKNIMFNSTPVEDYMLSANDKDFEVDKVGHTKSQKDGQFIIKKMQEGYSIKEIKDKFPELGSLRTIYNRVEEIKRAS